MSFYSQLNDRCSIYHAQIVEEIQPYGIPPNVTATYPDVPDLTDVPCHFNRRSGWGALAQNDPERQLTATIKVNFPLFCTQTIEETAETEDGETVIVMSEQTVPVELRMNDRIVNLENGTVYTAGPPMNIRGHHQAVHVQLIGTQREV